MVVAYTTAEGRDELLERLAEATDAIGVALAAIGEAYEQLDEYTSERLEQELFRPIQAAYGKAKRTHSEFAGRYELQARSFTAQPAGAPSVGAKGFIDHAIEATDRADLILIELQDSMLPVEVGDAQLRAGIAEVRELIGPLRTRARELVRRLGR